MTALPELRPATVDDVPGIRAVLAAHGNDGPVTTVDVVGPYVRHCVVHGRAFVAVEDGRVVGYGATVDAGVAWHLADLFVVPDRLGQGIGRPLLEAAFGDRQPRTTFASSDPRALPLYVRAGMSPTWPCLYLGGQGDAVPAPPPSIALETAGAARVAALEGAWTGHDRAADHELWASAPDADTFVVTEAGEPVAIAHARARQASTARALARMVVRPGADPVAPILAALRRAARDGRVDAFVAGPSPLLPVLLGLRFRVSDSDTYMASEPGLVDPARLVADGGML